MQTINNYNTENNYADNSTTNYFIGIVDELDTDKNYVKVTISMFGRETPVELELNQAEKLED